MAAIPSDKRRTNDCTDCIAFVNMLTGYRCGLGFQLEDRLERGDAIWEINVYPFDACTISHRPATKEEFVSMAKERGIEWEISEVAVPFDCDKI